jgi:hypothetical protein
VDDLIYLLPDGRTVGLREFLVAVIEAEAKRGSRTQTNLRAPEKRSTEEK